MDCIIRIPQTKEEVTVDWFNHVLKAEGIHIKSLTFLGDPNEGCGGFMSSLERVRLEITEDTSKTVILKTLPNDRNRRNYVIQAGFATREVQMYTKVFKDMEAFLASRGVSKEKYLFRHPKCYYGMEEGEGDSYSMVLILEDLVSSGYKPWTESIRKDLDWAYTSATIREMALLHAVSTAYGIVNKVDSFLNVYPFLMDLRQKDDKVVDYVKAGFEAVHSVFAESEEPMPPGLKEKLNSMATATATVVPDLIAHRAENAQKGRACLRHNDLHVGNIFFAHQNDSVSAALFDYQACVNDSPIYDLCFFQLLGCPIEASSIDLSKSIAFYHEIFTETMKEMKVDLVYSFDEMRDEFESSLLMALTHVISGAPVWCLGPQSNQVSRERLRQAILHAYDRNLLEYTPTYETT